MKQALTPAPNVASREAESWIEEEHIVTEGYPVFPSHFVPIPEDCLFGAAFLDFGGIVSRACRSVAESRRRVTGGGPRKARPALAIETTRAYRDVEFMLSAFGASGSDTARDRVVRVLDEYPGNAGTDLLRMVLDAIPITNCRLCAVEFDVRLLHVCGPENLAKYRRSVIAVDALLRDIAGASSPDS